jgi:excisionase family DNA binding protein
VEAIPRIALRVGEAAASLGISDDHFRRHVAPQLKWVRTGRVKLVACSELEEWLRRSSQRIVDDDRMGH